MSYSFPTSSGVRQGCILAPALFCRTVNWIMEQTARKARVQVGDKLYTDVDYADVVMAEQAETLRSALVEFHQTAADLGLHLSWQKTKIQNLGSGDPVADITVAGNTISVRHGPTWDLFSHHPADATQTYIDGWTSLRLIRHALSSAAGDNGD